MKKVLILIISISLFAVLTKANAMISEYDEIAVNANIKLTVSANLHFTLSPNKTLLVNWYYTFIGG